MKKINNNVWSKEDSKKLLDLFVNEFYTVLNEDEVIPDDKKSVDISCNWNKNVPSQKASINPEVSSLTVCALIASKEKGQIQRVSMQLNKEIYSTVDEAVRVQYFVIKLNELFNTLIKPNKKKKQFAFLSAEVFDEKRDIYLQFPIIEITMMPTNADFKHLIEGKF